MLSLARAQCSKSSALRLLLPLLATSRPSNSRQFPLTLEIRRFKSRKHKNDDTPPRKGELVSADFIPASQLVVSPEMKAEYDNMDTKMKAAVDWFRKDVAAMEARGSGRVSPDLISHVPVALPDRSARLSDIATIGVRDGTTLIITMFEDQDTKHVEKALYAAKIPNVVPQKVDHRTIKVPLPKPTVDARTEFVKIAAKQAEDVRVQLRKIESVGIKRAAPAKHSKNYEQFHKLMKNYSEDLNTILTSMKKSMGVK